MVRVSQATHITIISHTHTHTHTHTHNLIMTFRIFQKLVVRTRLDIYAFLIFIFIDIFTYGKHLHDRIITLQ